MPSNVFFFAAGSGANWDRTIARPVGLEALREILPPAHFEHLLTRSGGNPIHAWGAQPGAVGTIAGMAEGDVVFGSRKGHVDVGGLVALSLKEPSDVLSEHLWGAPDWPYVYFLADVVFGHRPAAEFLREMGEKARMVQGFRISHGASRKLHSANSPLEFVRESLGLPHPAASQAASDPVETTHNQVGPSGHTEAQRDLIQIGRSLGMDVWVASNDRSKGIADFIFRDHTIDTLPFQGQPEFHRRIELIDVIWLQGSAIRAAFEVEHSTQVYSGILRMGDLVAQFPNVSFPLYIVAPDADRKRICAEIRRPTFTKHGLDRLCSYIPYSRLRDAVGDVSRFGTHLQPTVIRDYVVTCD